MSVEIQWTDKDPDSGERRFVSVRKFSRRWHFKVRFKRREYWMPTPVVSKQMWQELLDALERRGQRAEGVSEEDIDGVKKIIAECG